MEIPGFVGVARDATGRKGMEEKLRLQSAALEAAAIGIVITNLEGIILWVNSAFTSLTGYAAEEAIGLNPRVLKSGKRGRPGSGAGQSEDDDRTQRRGGDPRPAAQGGAR